MRFITKNFFTRIYRTNFSIYGILATRIIIWRIYSHVQLFRFYSWPILPEHQFTNNFRLMSCFDQVGNDMLQVLVIAVAFSVCNAAPLASTNSSLTPKQNDRALYMKMYSSIEIPQSDISVLQSQLDEVSFRKVHSCCNVNCGILIFDSYSYRQKMTSKPFW